MSISLTNYKRILKKRLSGFLVCLICLNIPVCAAPHLDENGHYISHKEYLDRQKQQLIAKEREEIERKQREEWRLKSLKLYGVSCNENPYDKDCSLLTIKMAKISLNSYLDKYYDAYSVTIKNNYEKSININDLKGLFYENPNKKITDKINEVIKQRSKKRFPKSLNYIAYVPLLGWLWVIVLPATPLMYLIPPDEETREFALGPVYWLGAGTWYTIASPFYYFIDKKNDKLAKNEADSLLKHIDLIIKPSEEIQFNILSFTKPQLYIQFKKEDNDEIIKINFGRTSY